MSIASVDFETRSTTDLRKCGVYKYAEDPNTDVLCLAYAFDDGEPELWTPGMPFPDDLAFHIAEGGEMRAWNAAFERIIWKLVCGPKYGWPTVQDDQWFCTAAEAAAMALPRSLEQAAIVCKIHAQKDQAGYRAMMRLCKPKRVLEDGTIVWNEEPKDKAALYPYCKQDVRTERGLYKVVRRLTPKEREMFLLDQRMNDRGIQLDVPLVKASQHIVNKVVEDASETLITLTNGVVSGPTKVKAMKEWLAVQHDVLAPSLAKKSIAELLEGELPPEARELIRVRAEAGKESVKKLKAMMAVVGADERMRGLMLYHGAGTGRWAGRLVQPHNFPRGEIKDVERFIETVLARDYLGLDLFYPPLSIISGLLRPMLIAAPGHDLLAADFSAIECRGVNWLAGEDEIMENFRRGDAAPKADKPLYDVYRHMAVKMGRGRSVMDVTPQGRQAGKAAELGCGFQMGPEKFVTAAWDVYQVKLTLAEAKDAVKIYRESHPCVVRLWNDANDAALLAVETPGSVHTIGPGGCVRFTCRGAYLYIVLPSGRPLAYAAPHIVNAPMPWNPKDLRPAVEFYGINPETRKWGPMRLYGGLIVENIVQALARDLMAEGMLALDKCGYPPILSVHDEVVSETQKAKGSLEEFESVLRTAPEWAKDFPIMTEGWRGERYRK